MQLGWQRAGQTVASPKMQSHKERSKMDTFTICGIDPAGKTHWLEVLAKNRRQACHKARLSWKAGAGWLIEEEE